MTYQYRWAENRYGRLPALAAELVRLKADIIVTHTTPGTRAAQQATTTIPIVMASSGDAVASGLVASLARPGGNTTGLSFFVPELNAKQMELLREAIPRIRRVAVLLNSANPLSELVLKEMERTARSLGIEVRPTWVRRGDELDSAFSELVKARSEGLVIMEDAILIDNVERIADLAARQRLPVAAGLDYVRTGSLLSYGVNIDDLWRRAATFVDKILKGAKPGDLPVEQPTKFELVINLKTAKALGVTIPRSIQSLADQVIQ